MNIIIDYGVGNIGSIANMLKKINVDSVITSDVALIKKAERLILCGVGAFDYGMSKLESLGIVDVIKEKALVDKIPILGICLGMQLFMEGSEEGSKSGLGIINGFTRKFDFSVIPDNRHLRIPHMGWNRVELAKPSAIFEEMYEEPSFYFVHSYHVVLEDKQDELLNTTYGYNFTSAFERDNIVGVQFHPEKSHKFGIKLYQNFIKNIKNVSHQSNSMFAVEKQWISKNGEV